MNFALFEDCLNPEKANSYLFSDIRHEITAWDAHEVLPALEKINQLRQQGFFLAGYLAYEAVNAIYPQLNLPHDEERPLLHFRAFHQAQQFASRDLGNILPQFTGVKSPTSALFDYLELANNYCEYLEKFTAVRQQLTRGNTYQLNLTLPLAIHSTIADLDLLYYTLSRSHPVAYASYLPFMPQSIISISPELFFKKTGTNIQVRPMKGTMPRGATPKQDQQLSHYLAQDPKNRAENLIIVDLLRNDLAKFCQTGSVTVPRLFEIEKYASLFQMTSTINAKLDIQTDLAIIIQGLFPCGSISGAPKLSTLQLIEQIEGYSRGVYCGAIGYILPDNDMRFSVAIRTLSAKYAHPQELLLGVGGGITIQATPQEEWQEILTKLNFVRKWYHPEFKLIESLLVENAAIHNLEQHLERLDNSAQRLLFSCQIEPIKQALLDYVTLHCQSPLRYKLRIELDYCGRYKIEHQTIAANPEYLSIAIAPIAVDSRHPLFRHKTDSQLTRGVYTQIDKDYKPSGVDELIFINQDGIITESRYHNVIIKHRDKLITTPVAHGLLNGIFRSTLVDSQQVKESAISTEMVLAATAIFLCNDVRGMIPARLKILDLE